MRRGEARFAEWFPASRQIPRPLVIKAFDGKPQGREYALKPDFARRISLEPRTLEDGSRSTFSTRKKPIWGAERVELALALDRAGLAHGSSSVATSWSPRAATSRSSARRTRASDSAPASDAAATDDHGREDALNQSRFTRQPNGGPRTMPRRGVVDVARSGKPTRLEVCDRVDRRTPSIIDQTRALRNVGIVAGADHGRAPTPIGSAWIVASTSRARVERRNLCASAFCASYRRPGAAVMRANVVFPVISGRNIEGVGAPAVDAERRVNDGRRRSPQLVEGFRRADNPLNSEEGKWLQTEK